MNKKEINRFIYKEAYTYLLELLPEDLTEESIQKYFLGDNKDFNSLEDVFERIIESAQNYQRMPNVIKFTERKFKIKRLLSDYKLSKIAEMNVNDLYQTFRKEFGVTSADSKYNSWYKWSKSICDAAKFMCNFKSVDDFKHFIGQFDYNTPTRMALPLLISTKISGIGFALACDFLKELGYVNYPKPDVHLIEVFNKLGLTDDNPVSVFEAIVKMSEDCIDEDKTATPYKIDKIIWLICSGKFYLDDITIGRHRDELIQIISRKLQE